MASSNSRTVQVNIVGDSSKLTGAMKKAGDESVSAGQRIGGAWRAVGSQLSAAFGGALEPVLSTLDGVGEALDGIREKGATVGGVMLGIGAAGAAVGTALNIFGSKDQAAEQQLAQAFKNVGANVDDYKGKIDDTVKSMAKYGYTNDEVHAALTSLVTATKNPTESLNLMGTAANLAALKHESLTSATQQLVQVVGGKGTRTLAQLGITAKTTGKGAVSVSEALQMIAQRVNGQANAAADTFTGKLRGMRAEIENQVSSIGQKYGPALQGASAAMAVLGGGVETVSGLLEKFRGADEAVSTAEGLKTAAEGVDTAAEGAEAAGAAAADAASLPLIATVGLIVAAVAILGVGIYELVTHWRQAWSDIKAIVVDAWHGIDDDFIQPIERFFEGVVGFIESHWQLILAILTGPIGLAILVIKDHFNDIVSFIESLPNTIARFAEHMWDGISDAFKGMIDWIIGLWNGFANDTQFTLPSIHVGPLKIGGEHIGPLLPTLPMFAQGAIATGPTLGMFGEAGPEAVVPLDRASDFGFGGGGDIVVPVTIAIDGRQFAQATAQYTRKQILQTTARNARKVGLS